MNQMSLRSRTAEMSAATEAFDPRAIAFSGEDSKPAPRDRLMLQPKKTAFRRRYSAPKKYGKAKTATATKKTAKRSSSYGKTRYHKPHHYTKMAKGMHIVRPLQKPMNYFHARLLTSWSAKKYQFVMVDQYNCCVRWM
jgi:hypothetical protein